MAQPATDSSEWCKARPTPRERHREHHAGARVAGHFVGASACQLQLGARPPQRPPLRTDWCGQELRRLRPWPKRLPKRPPRRLPTRATIARRTRPCPRRGHLREAARAPRQSRRCDAEGACLFHERDEGTFGGWIGGMICPDDFDREHCPRCGSGELARPSRGDT